ncbi:uncharacterized protein J3D65DRAFT_145314 [Phyllosticta citribraziliensis]|uniref:Secreted protein n=1 Tax=Phyllosticta citribraziliensis TaxID=989973 RepID=A0ABR1L6Z5_9PEZI
MAFSPAGFAFSLAISLAGSTPARHVPPSLNRGKQGLFCVPGRVYASRSNFSASVTAFATTTPICPRPCGCAAPVGCLFASR